jgi:hypothetical protein
MGIIGRSWECSSVLAFYRSEAFWSSWVNGQGGQGGQGYFELGVNILYPHSRRGLGVRQTPVHPGQTPVHPGHHGVAYLWEKNNDTL